MKQLSLKYRIALTLFALTGVMLAVLLWQVQRMQDDAVSTAQASDEAVIMDVLGELSRFALIKSEYSDLEHYFSMVRKNPHVVKIIVADASDRIVVSTDAGLLGVALPVLQDNASSYWRTRKLTNAAGSQGLIAVEFSNAELFAARKRTRTWAGVVALFSMSLIALASVIMGNALTRRLAVLSRAAKRIGDGDFSTRIDLPGSDEVSELGQTVDAMARKIEAALEDLKVSELRFTSAFEHAPIGMALVGLDERFIQVNQALCDMLGHPREKLLTMTVPDVTHPDDRAAEEVHKSEAQAEGRSDFQMVKRYLHADGHVVWGQLSVSIVTDSQGKPQYFIGQLEDITERRRAEEKIRNLNRVYAVLSNINQAIIRIREPRRMFQEACRIAVEDGGFRMAWIGLVDGPTGVITPAAIAGLNDGYVEKLMISLNSESRGRGPTGSAVREGRHSVFNDIEHDERMAPWREDALQSGFRSSAAFPLVVSGTVRGSLNLYAGTPHFFDESEVKLLDELALDISYAMEFAEQESRRSRAESDLRAAEEKYRTLVEQIPAITYVASPGPDPSTLYMSPQVESILGFTIDEWKADSDLWLKQIHPEDRERVLHDLESSEAKGETFRCEYRMQTSSGRVVWIRDEAVLLRDDNGSPQALQGVMYDITELRRTEEERQKLISLIETSTDMIGISTLDGEVTYLNNARKNLVGIDSLEEVHRTRISDYIATEDVKRFLEEVVPTIQKTGTWTGEIRFRHWKTGETVPVELTGLMIFDPESGRPLAMASISRDIRVRKNLETQLLQAQKMEAVGQLAGGIAHDFNNILTAIIGYGNIALMKLSADDPVCSSVEQILSSADRAAGLTRSLLAFSRKQIINPQPVAMNSIINRVQKLLRHVIGEDIELRIALTEQDPTVHVDSGQIEQMLINLATNACDAMPKGGELTIETGLSRIDDEYIRHHGYGKTGEYVRISVTDTGEGMDEPTRQRVFEPFFTTKKVGKGTGLGLAMVYGSVKQHNGYINLYSEPGRGTTFNIYLPVLNAPAKPLASAEAQAIPERGNETVLLAEDDPSVRNVTRKVLEEFGYTVIEAEDGEEALEKLSHYRAEITVLILDVVMPKKNGKEVFEEAKRLKPGIKVLFTSGYPAHIIQEKGKLEKGLSFIAKPAAPHDLLNKLREVLDQ